MTGMVLVGAWATAAHAACDKELKAVETAAGEAVPTAFGVLATCDGAKAAEALPTAVKRTGDVDSLAGLAVVAIDAGLYPAVHGLLELVPDYSAREETARAIGAACAGDPKVVTFLAELHDAVKDRTFVGWSGALASCSADELTQRLERLTSEPPPRAFDDKYAAVVDLYAQRQRTAALPVLEKAATAAAPTGGPLALVVDAMVKCVTPEGIGAKPSDADRTALVAALQRVAGSASPDGLHRLANAMVAVGAPDAAGALLPKLYPDRVQSNGSFLYGLASVERCDDASVVHWTVVEDPSKRWSIAQDVDGPARAFKGRLKCGAEVSWTIQLTPEPVKQSDEVEAWAESIAGDAKLREEKRLVLR
jgi:hypothetical protein